MFTIPDSLKTLADRLAYCYAASEKLRQLHNAKAEDRGRAQWLKESFLPKSIAISAAINALHDEIAVSDVSEATSLIKGRKLEWNDKASWSKKVLLAKALRRRGGFNWADPNWLELEADIGTKIGAIRQSEPKEVLDAVDLSETDTPVDDLPDPTEDFTTYTEYDPPGWITIDSASKASATFRPDVTNYLYKDHGAGYVTGNFTHTFDYYAAWSGDIWCHFTPWCVSNNIEDQATLYTNTRQALSLFAIRPSSYQFYVSLVNFYANTSDDSAYYDWTDRAHWLTIERSSITLQAHIYTDSARTTLFETLSLTVPTDSYRYVFPLISWNYGGARSGITGYSQNLDLHIAAAGQPYAKRLGGVPYCALNRGVW